MLVGVKPLICSLGGRWSEAPTDDACVMMRFKEAGLKTAPCPEGLVAVLKRRLEAAGSTITKGYF